MSEPRSFEQQVRDAIEAIPHGAKCPAQPVEYPVDVAEMVTITVTHGMCNCDREERIAQRVAAAIEAGAAVHSPTWPDSARRAALAVLRGDV